MATAEVETLLTAEEYFRLPDNGRSTELVRGRLVEMNMPAPRHGYYCLRIGRLLGNYAENHDLGRVMSNDSGVVTEHNPDTVRGADVSYYSYARLPRGPLPHGYLTIAPEVVFEVRSPTDRWGEILTKIGEYLNAGVLVVGLLDPDDETITLYRNERPHQTLTVNDELTLPEVHAELRIAVRRFFE